MQISPHVCLYVSVNYSRVHQVRLRLPQLDYSDEIELGGLVSGINKVEIGLEAIEYPVNLGKFALFGFGGYRFQCEGFDCSGDIIPRYSGWHTKAFRFDFSEAK